MNLKVYIRHIYSQDFVFLFKLNCKQYPGLRSITEMRGIHTKPLGYRYLGLLNDKLD